MFATNVESLSGYEYVVFRRCEIKVSAKTAMNISDSVDKLLNSIVIYDDIWGKEEDGIHLLFFSCSRRCRSARYRKII